MLIRVAAAYLAFSGFLQAEAGEVIARSIGFEAPRLSVTDDLCAVWSPPRRTESRSHPTVLCPRFWG